jgi:hypothetical protein
MKAFNGYKAEKPVYREALPAGGYLAKIISAEEAIYSWGSQLVIKFDIASGEYEGHFQHDYDQQDETYGSKKWKGCFRLRIPAESDQYFEIEAKQFGNAMWAIEESNPGFSWNWDESQLKGKDVGVLFRNKEWEYNGKTGWTTECCKLNSTENIKSGKFKQPKDKPLKNKPKEESEFSQIADDDLVDFQF